MDQQTQGKQLTPREIEILRFIVLGYSIKEIAEDLSISPATVHNHRTSINLKLNLPGKQIVPLIHYAIRKGIIEPF